MNVFFVETFLPLLGVNVPFEVRAIDFADLSILRPALVSLILSFALPAFFTVVVPDATTTGLRTVGQGT